MCYLISSCMEAFLYEMLRQICKSNVTPFLSLKDVNTSNEDVFLQQDVTLRVVAWKPPCYFAVWTQGLDRSHLSPPSDVIINGRSYNANKIFISINSTHIVVNYSLIRVPRSNYTMVCFLFSVAILQFPPECSL